MYVRTQVPQKKMPASEENCTFKLDAVYDLTPHPLLMQALIH